MRLKPNIVDTDMNWLSLRKTEQVGRILDQAANTASWESTPNYRARTPLVIGRVNDKFFHCERG